MVVLEAAENMALSEGGMAESIVCVSLLGLDDVCVELELDGSEGEGEGEWRGRGFVVTEELL